MADASSKCLLAFLRGDYVACEELARAELADHTPVTWVAHVLITSVRRQGRAAEAATMATTLAEVFRDDLWAAALLRLSMGTASAPDVLTAASDESQRCQARYYAGAFLLTQGEAQLASSEWHHCRISRATPEEKTLAEIETARASESVGLEVIAPFAAPEDALELTILDALKTGDGAALEKAARSALERKPPPAWAAFVLATTARRASRPDSLRVAEAAAAGLRSAPFEELLFQVGSGTAAPITAFAQAPDEAARARVFYYTGSLLVGQGNHDAGLEQWDAFKKSKAAPFERKLAEAEAARIREALVRRDFQRLYSEQQAAYGRGDVAAALGRAADALDLARKAFPEGHEMVATGLANLAEAHRRKGALGDAEKLLKDSLEAWRAAAGAESPSFLVTLQALATLYLEMGRPAQAEPLLRRVIDARVAALGPTHPDVANAVSTLAYALARSSEPEGAEPWLRRLVELLRSTGERKSDLATALHVLGSTLLQSGRFSDADAALRQALDLRRSLFGDTHPETAQTATALAKLLDAISSGGAGQAARAKGASEPPRRASGASGAMKAVAAPSNPPRARGASNPPPKATPPPLPAAPLGPLFSKAPRTPSTRPPPAGLPRECQSFLETRHTRLLRTLGGYTFKSSEKIEGVLVPPDEAGVYTFDEQGRLVFWDSLNGLPIRSVMLDAEPRTKPTAASLSADGRFILVGRFNAELQLFDVETGGRKWSSYAAAFVGPSHKKLKVLPPIQSVAFSPDGEVAASSAESEDVVRIWDIARGTRLGELPGKAPLAFSSDGALLWAGDTLFDARSWQELSSMKALDGARVRSAAFSPDGTHVLLGCSKGTVVLFHVKRGQPTWLTKIKDPLVAAVGFNKDGNPYGVSHGLHVWELASGKELSSAAFSATHHVAFAPQRARLYGVARGSRILRQLEANWGVELDSDGHAESVRSIEFAPEGSTAITASPDTTVRLWHLGTGATMKTFSWGKFLFAGFFPDGKRVLGVSELGLRVYDVESGEVTGELKRFGEREVTHVSISPDGSKVALASEDGHASLFDVAKKSISWRERLGAEFTAFNSDGTRVHLVTANQEIRTMEAETGRFLEKAPIPDSGKAQPHIFLRDDKRVMSVITGEGLALRELKTGEVHCMMPDAKNATRLLALSPDERAAITRTASGGFAIWDVAEAALFDVIDLGTSNDRAECARFSPDGSLLLVGTARGVVLSFELR